MPDRSLRVTEHRHRSCACISPGIERYGTCDVAAAGSCSARSGAKRSRTRRTMHLPLRQRRRSATFDTIWGESRDASPGGRWSRADLTQRGCTRMRSDEVEVRSVRVLRGPNLYAYMPVLHIVLDIGPYEERPSNTFDGFVDRLTNWLPGLELHECSLERPGGFVERLRRGTYLGHIAEHVTLELQGLMGFDVTFGRARGTSERGVYDVIIA